MLQLSISITIILIIIMQAQPRKNTTAITDYHTTFHIMGILAMDVWSYIMVGRLDTPTLQKQLNELEHLLQSAEDVQQVDNHSLNERQPINLEVPLIEQQVIHVRKQSGDLWASMRAQSNPRTKRSMSAFTGIALIGATLANFLYAGSLRRRVDQIEMDTDAVAHKVTVATKTVVQNSERLNILNNTLCLLTHHLKQGESMIATEVT